MKYIIVLEFEGRIEAWGSLTDLCRNHKPFSYNYLKGKKFPFTYKKVKFIKVPFKMQQFVV